MNDCATGSYGAYETCVDINAAPLYFVCTNVFFAASIEGEKSIDCDLVDKPEAVNVA